jgi:hypothetical protein
MDVRRGAPKGGRPRAPPGPGGDDAERRAAALRDHLVPLVRLKGQWHQYGYGGGSGPLRLTTWETGPFRCVLRIPFGPPGVRAPWMPELPKPVLSRGRRPAPLSYGLDVWTEERVLSIAWAPDGTLEVVTFQRGTWEDEALALALG